MRHRVAEAGPVNEKLASIIGRWTEGVEDRSTPIPNLTLFRREAPTKPALCLVEPSVLLVVQGTKQLVVGKEAYPYDAGRFLITSLDLPANSQTIIASPGKPCLGLALKLDLRMIAELIGLGDLPAPRERSSDRSIGIGTISPLIMEAFKHLLDLLDEPTAIAVLAPIFQREIHYRLLLSDQAARLRQIASVGSQSHRIARAIDWLKLNYSSPFRVNELATRVQMSSTVFRHHFRKLTAMSPLQYQKWLRLNEARRLMLNEKLDASAAAFQVGNESPSQFSREYSRLFGAPPKRDIDSLRRKAEGLDAAPDAVSV
jgi:AraC-like DNA-binding protein